VSKDFDTTLSDAIDLAAHAAHTTGAAGARTRGRQRTMRTRIAMSTTSLVIVAVGATVAFKATSSHDGGTPRLTAASPTATASSTPSSAASPSGSPTQTASSSASSAPGSASSSASSNPSTTGSTIAQTASETWLTAGQLPYDSTMKWSAGSPNHCTGSLVITELYAGGCSEHTDPSGSHFAKTMDTAIFNSTGVPTGNGAWAGTSADQEFYGYASPAAAQSAYQYITQAILGEDSQFVGDLDANAPHLPVVSTTTETAHADGAMAIDQTLRDNNGKPAQLNGNDGGQSDLHYYFAVRGDLVEMVVLSGGPAVSVTTNDATTLQTVAGALL